MVVGRGRERLTCWETSDHQRMPLRAARRPGLGLGDRHPPVLDAASSYVCLVECVGVNLCVGPKYQRVLGAECQRDFVEKQVTTRGGHFTINGKSYRM